MRTNFPDAVELDHDTLLDDVYPARGCQLRKCDHSPEQTTVGVERCLGALDPREVRR